MEMREGLRNESENIIYKRKIIQMMFLRKTTAPFANTSHGLVRTYNSTHTHLLERDYINALISYNLCRTAKSKSPMKVHIPKVVGSNSQHGRSERERRRRNGGEGE